MNTNFLNVLECPVCKGNFTLNKESSMLSCEKCKKEFSINDGIAQFLSTEELAGNNRASQKFYNFFAPFFDLFNKVVLLMIGGEENARLEYMKRLELKDGCRVLEVSVGTGANLSFVPRFSQNTELWGLDISSAQLARCNKKLKKLGLQSQLVLGRAEELPFKDQSFDIVFHIGGINFFSDRKRAIEEMIRVAKPGTKILIADETEKAKKMYEKVGIKPWEGKKGPIFAPVDLVPEEMKELNVISIWKGYGYCMEFRKP